MAKKENTQEAAPRRSGRATKGQSQRVIDYEDVTRTSSPQPASAKVNRKSGPEKLPATADEEDEQNEEDAGNDVIRCPCGDDDDSGFMVACDTCGVWQHAECVGIPSENDAPENYFCERCRPDLHEALLKELEEEKKLPKGKAASKKGKGKGKKSAKVAKDEKPQVDKDEPEYKVDSEDEQEEDEPLSSPVRRKSLMQQRKRKTPEHDDIDDSDFDAEDDTEIKPRKTRRLSHSAQDPRKSTTKRPTLLRKNTVTEQEPDTPTARDAIRVAVLKQFTLVFEKIVETMAASGSYTLPENMTATQKVEELAEGVEGSMFNHFHADEGKKKVVTPQYREKARNLLSHLKDEANPSLRQRILDGEITPEALVTMKNEELQRPELRALAEAVKAESMKQAVLVEEKGPRVRRTHKGEEIIGDVDMGFTNTEPSAPGITRRGTDEEIPANSESSRITKKESLEQSPDVEMGEGGVAYEHEGPVSPAQFSSSDTIPAKLVKTSSFTAPSESPAERKTNFDISSVWNNVATMSPPVHDDDPDAPSRKGSKAKASANVDFDPDIDALLGGVTKQEEEDDDVPYSPPADFAALEEMTKPKPVWKGPVTLPRVAQFSCSAYKVGGPEFKHIPGLNSWNDCFEATVVIEGRIGIEQSTKYLCAQKHSTSKEVVVFKFTADDDENAKNEFKKLYEHFQSRERHGVIRSSLLPAVKDAYIVALSPDATIPEFVELLGDHDVPLVRDENMLLAVFVVNKGAKRNSVPAPSATPASNPPWYQSPADPRLANQSPSETRLTGQMYMSPVEHTPQQQSLYSPPTHQQYIPPPMPAPVPVPASAAAPAPSALGFSPNDLALLQAIIVANPEVAANPAMLQDPVILSALIQRHQATLAEQQRAQQEQQGGSRWDRPPSF
ncbi:Histone deacetylase complex subunit [Saitoella coloradoensis]